MFKSIAKFLLTAFAVLCALGLSAVILRADDKPAASPATVTGEVLDMACYTDHGAMGEKHAGCAQKCIASGLPVGIKEASSGKVFLVIGAHTPINDQLAPYGGKTVTLTGKVVSRDGINLLENAEIVK